MDTLIKIVKYSNVEKPEYAIYIYYRKLDGNIWIVFDSMAYSGCWTTTYNIICSDV